MGIASRSSIMLFDSGTTPRSIDIVMGEIIIGGAFVVDYEQCCASREE